MARRQTENNKSANRVVQIERHKECVKVVTLLQQTCHHSMKQEWKPGRGKPLPITERVDEGGVSTRL